MNIQTSPLVIPKETNVITRHILVLLGLTPLLFGANQASANTLKSDRSECYGYLTELVRSSNFPFTYVTKDKAADRRRSGRDGLCPSDLRYRRLRHHGLGTVRHPNPAVAQHVG